MKLTIVGDIHGRFTYLNQIINQEKPDLLICLGEFGYWPNSNWMDIKNINNTICPIWWINGNHCDFYSLNRRTSNEILPNIWYKPRGSIERIGDKNFLFLGGGFSIDYKQRVVGFDYFPDDELLKMSDIANIPKGTKIDVVCSHTAPNEFIMIGPERDRDWPDSSRVVLDKVLKKYKPREWYMGHWHLFKEGCYDHKDGKFTSWTCLNMVPNHHCYRSIVV
jgi:Icc-related predicted phosphoesterase